MRVQIRYRKNLKMSEGKLSAQVFHLAVEMGVTDKQCDVIVLRCSDKTFFQLAQHSDAVVFYDAGKTEVERGTATVLGWIEE